MNNSLQKLDAAIAYLEKNCPIPVPRKTLKDVMPNEFMTADGYLNACSRYYANSKVLQEIDSRNHPWPGTHKNVHFWVLLEHGRAVGWNESPTHGWSFPVIRNMKTIQMAEKERQTNGI